ncbi:hypothetical protein DXU03_13260 [Rhizobium johnstonii]
MYRKIRREQGKKDRHGFFLPVSANGNRIGHAPFHAAPFALSNDRKTGFQAPMRKAGKMNAEIFR